MIEDGLLISSELTVKLSHVGGVKIHKHFGQEPGGKPYWHVNVLVAGVWIHVYTQRDSYGSEAERIYDEIVEGLRGN